MIRNWTHHVPLTSLHYREADAADPAIDDFDCGREPYAEEVRDFFVQRGWFGEMGREPTTCLQFGTERDILEYAAVTVVKVGHPTRRASATRRYLLVAQVGVASKFQGVRERPTGTRKLRGRALRGLEGPRATTRMCRPLSQRAKGQREGAEVLRSARFRPRRGVPVEALGSEDAPSAPRTLAACYLVELVAVRLTGGDSDLPSRSSLLRGFHLALDRQDVRQAVW